MVKLQSKRMSLLLNRTLGAAFASVLLHLVPLEASIIDIRELKIDLTNTNALSRCEWSPADKYSITSGGLGWDGAPDGNELGYGSILTKPFSLAYFWRPTTSVSIKVEMRPGPRMRTEPDAHYWEDAGQMFARYSPDLVHWSSWQALQRASLSNRIFTGQIAIPSRERAAYEKLRVEYETRNSSQGSNEEKVVRWITKNNPGFFANHLPFVGYVQLLFEGEFVAGNRFKQLDASFSFSVGGLHTEPSDSKEREQFQKDMMTVPWRFKGATQAKSPSE